MISMTRANIIENVVIISRASVNTIKDNVAMIDMIIEEFQDIDYVPVKRNRKKKDCY
jgi:hypothetical protein